MGRRGCGAYPSTGAAQAVGSAPLAVAAGGGRAKPGRVTRSLPPASKRLLPGARGGGDTLRGGGGGVGRATGKGRGGSGGWDPLGTRLRRLGPTEGARTRRWRKAAELSQSQAREEKGSTDK